MQNFVTRRPVWSGLAVFVAAFAVMFLLMVRDINIYDEGIVLTDALRVMVGEIPHRDYYANYGPGQFYVVAALFSIFGKALIVSRVYGLAIMASIVAMTFFLLVRRVQLWVCLVASFICGAWIIAIPQYLYPVFPTALLAMLGSALLLAPDGLTRWQNVALAGATAGVAALFRYDTGFFILVAHCIAIIALIASGAPMADRIRRALPMVLIYGIAAGVVFLPLAISFLLVAPVSSFIADILDYPIHYYARMRGLPFPTLSAMRQHPDFAGVYFPIGALLIALWLLIEQRRRGLGISASGRLDAPFLIVFSLLTAVLYYKGVVRVSTTHMILAILPAILLLALVANRWWERGGIARIVAGAALLLAFLPSAVGAFREVRSDVSDKQRTVIGWALGLGKGASVCDKERQKYLSRLDAPYQAVVNYLDHFSGPNDRIFAGLDRHDKMFVNPVALYYAADRLPGTHWQQFDPGLQTRADIQMQMVGDLNRNRVRWIVRDGSFGDIVEPNQSSKSSGVFILDRFIAAHYRPVAQTGKVSIWLKNGIAVPSIPAGCMPEPIADR